MKANRAEHAVWTRCRVLGVSPSGSYACRGRGRCSRAKRAEELRGTIRAIHEESRGTYGVARVPAERAGGGCRVSRKRVARLMRESGLVGVSRRRGTRTPRVDSTRGAAPDRVARPFHADAPARLWVADIPYVPTWAGFVFLAVVRDGFSRRGVGWAMAPHLRTERGLAALNMAIGQRRPDGVVHHSDQGTQYPSLAFGKRGREMRVVTSTGSAGDGFDNAMAESFFATLECELIDRRPFESQAEARMAVFEFIEAWYNRKRRHSALGYLSPEEFERTAAQGASRPAASTGQHDRTTGLGAVRSDDLEVHNGLQELPYPSAMGQTSPPPAIAHLTTGDESPNVSTRPG